MSDKRAEAKEKKSKRNKKWYGGLTKEKKKERVFRSKEYFERFRWIKHWYSAKNRIFGTNSKHYLYKGLEFTLTKDEVYSLWQRDNAISMKKPSLDRKETSIGYTLDNCRFIELVDNVKRGHFSIKLKQLEDKYIQREQALREEHRKVLERISDVLDSCGHVGFHHAEEAGEYSCSIGQAQRIINAELEKGTK